ncbi:hypothetical protein PVA44_01010 [Entomospira nematocerorum]|uniref:Uncharacterized protein n=1 Tax=Entomospira nematocerorum TaxID=2719987 RepID=A0A968GFN9_9SPIO|nr:hypothetical protein [Entomospira nematocera]NIZ47383.1 hypothetical protein [Entomospira nematocera]WDI34077.1 hypothetical protein PVA44_01010 [Entomospira nematocera]
MGFKITPHMVSALGQDASVKLDVLQTENLEFIGDFSISIESGDTFELWISPFLLNYADMTITDKHFKLRSAHSPQGQPTTEQVRLVIPTDRLRLTLSGESETNLHNLHLSDLTIDALGRHHVTLSNIQVSSLEVRNIGSTILMTTNSNIESHRLTNLGTMTVNGNIKQGMQLNQVNSFLF